MLPSLPLPSTTVPTSVSIPTFRAIAFVSHAYMSFYTSPSSLPSMWWGDDDDDDIYICANHRSLYKSQFV